MKTFHIKADFTFSAEDVDDAFRKLSIHFSDIATGFDSDLIESGTISVKPEGQE